MFWRADVVGDAESALVFFTHGRLYSTSLSACLSVHRDMISLVVIGDQPDLRDAYSLCNPNLRGETFMILPLTWPAYASLPLKSGVGG
jgi:hypothetical protein